MKRMVSQMNPNDNQIVQCCDGYVMTSPWHDTEGHVVTTITFRISGETNDTDSILELHINNSTILEFLGHEYGEIDTKIESVASVLDEIRQVTEIVTSVTF